METTFEVISSMLIGFLAGGFVCGAIFLIRKELSTRRAQKNFLKSLEMFNLNFKDYGKEEFRENERTAAGN